MFTTASSAFGVQVTLPAAGALFVMLDVAALAEIVMLLCPLLAVTANAGCAAASERTSTTGIRINFDKWGMRVLARGYLV
jgi:hypothetical protein